MKILIVITSPLFIRNYVETDAFQRINGKETYITCSSNISNKKSVTNDKNFVGEFEANKIKESLFIFFTYLLMYSSRNVNKGFFFYFKTRNPTIYYSSIRLKNKVHKLFSNKVLRYISIRFLEFLRPFFHPVSLLKFCLIVLIDSLKLTSLAIKIYNFLLIRNKELKSIIENVNPDLVLIPNGGLDVNCHEVLALSNASNFKTMLEK